VSECESVRVFECVCVGVVGYERDIISMPYTHTATSKHTHTVIPTGVTSKNRLMGACIRLPNSTLCRRLLDRTLADAIATQRKKAKTTNARHRMPYLHVRVNVCVCAHI
jgi:hypothetical protein